MSTTLKALNRLEPLRVLSKATGGPAISCSSKIGQASFRSIGCRNRRHIVLVAVCPVFIILGVLFVSALKTNLLQGREAFKGHTIPTIRYPIPRQPAISKVNQSAAFRWQSIDGSSKSIAGNKNTGIADGLISEPQDTITQYQGDGLKLHAIVWSMNPAARKAFINYRFVSQGHTVGNYFVAAISEKSIVLSDGHQLWRLILGR